MRTRQKCMGVIVMLALLLVAGVVPGQAWRGGHGFRGHGFHHGFRGARVGIGIGIGLGPFWGPYWPRYAYPPVVVAPPPVVVQPSPPAATQPPPPAYWYYCEDSKAYYPYVQQCPSGWRQVAPTPP